MAWYEGTVRVRNLGEGIGLENPDGCGSGCGVRLRLRAVSTVVAWLVFGVRDWPVSGIYAGGGGGGGGSCLWKTACGFCKVKSSFAVLGQWL